MKRSKSQSKRITAIKESKGMTAEDLKCCGNCHWYHDDNYCEQYDEGTTGKCKCCHWEWDECKAEDRK